MRVFIYSGSKVVPLIYTHCIQAFLRVFLQVKNSPRTEGITEEWHSLEKEVARYNVEDSNDESEKIQTMRWKERRGMVRRGW
jgi:hypothetical protein